MTKCTGQPQANLYQLKKFSPDFLILISFVNSIFLKDPVTQMVLIKHQLWKGTLDGQLCQNKIYYKPSYDKLNNFLLDYSLMIENMLHVMYEVQELAKGKKIFTLRYFTGKDQVFDIFGVQS